VREALADTPVVLIHGPRQSGKSTLAKNLVNDEFPAAYVTFDDLTTLGAASSSPADFLERFDGPVVIDEAQRLPELFVAIKAAVDKDRRPGRFVLTGSADVRFVPAVADALVGRVEILTLWPLSQGEIEGRKGTFIDAVFAGHAPQPGAASLRRRELLERALIGGYPEAVRRRQEARRRSWFGAYVSTVLQREIRDLTQIEGLAELPRLLALVAARAGATQNIADLARVSGMPQSTVKRYLALLNAAFLVRRVPAWSENLGKRLLKSPKLYPVDAGLMAHLLGIDAEGLEAAAAPTGALLETFVVGELVKQVGWSETQPVIHHFRTARQQEVDVVLEDARRRIVGIEIKASSTARERDFRHLAFLRDTTGERFKLGVVVYSGQETVSFGERLYAVPVASLWRAGETRVS